MCNQINHAVAYSLLADTTRDNQNNEDLAICARFTDLNGFVQERCFALVQINFANAAFIASSILINIDVNGLDRNKLIAKGYDKANVMSGSNKSVKKLFLIN